MCEVSNHSADCGENAMELGGYCVMELKNNKTGGSDRLWGSF